MSSSEIALRVERSAHAFFVWRHSGRIGERWRIVFESGDRTEAWAEYTRRLPKTSIFYAATRITRGLIGGTTIAQSGMEPADTHTIPVGDLDASEARERREARAATRSAARRLRVDGRLRIAPVVEAVVDSDEDEEPIETIVPRRLALPLPHGNREEAYGPPAAP